MSKPRYNWWPFVLNIIHDYPERRAELKKLKEQKVTASMTGMPKASGNGRGVENLAIKSLRPQEQKEHDAVMMAVNRTKIMPDGKLRLGVVRLTLWRNFNIAGAAMQLNVSERTARRYRWQFILLTGCVYGFLTEEEYRAAIKKDMPT